MNRCKHYKGRDTKKKAKLELKRMCKFDSHGYKYKIVKCKKCSVFYLAVANFCDFCKKKSYSYNQAQLFIERTLESKGISLNTYKCPAGNQLHVSKESMEEHYNRTGYYGGKI